MRMIVAEPGKIVDALIRVMVIEKDISSFCIYQYFTLFQQSSRLLRFSESLQTFQ